MKNNLKEIRKAKNINQDELAKEVGVGQSSIASYEKGVLDLSLAQFDTILNLCVSLNCKAVDLFNDEYAEKCKRLSRRSRKKTH
jgi:DNA-binding XRE family transcriptional regulator